MRRTRHAVAVGLLLVGLAASPTATLRAHDGIHVDIDKLNAQIAAEPTPRADLHLLRARLLREHGKPELALEDLDRVREILGAEDTSETTRIEVPLVRAQALVDLSRSAEAVPLLDAVIADAGDRRPRALDLRATLREDAEELAAAIEDRERAFAAQPTLERALALGAALRRTGRREAAATHYERATIALGESLLVRDAWISVEIERGEYESALTMIGDQLERSAVRTPWLLRRAEVYEAAGNAPARDTALAAALVEANRILERRALPVHLVTRARVHLARGDLDAAEADARAALARVPKFALARELLETIQARRGADDKGEAESPPPDEDNS